MVQIEGVHSLGELISKLKVEIIGELEEKGIFEVPKIEKKRAQALSKKWLKVNDIKKAQLWGDISTETIRRTIKQIPSSEKRNNQNAKKPFYEVSNRAARIEAEKRGII